MCVYIYLSIFSYLSYIVLCFFTLWLIIFNNLFITCFYLFLFSKFSKNAKLTVFSNFTRAWLLCSQNDRLEVIQSRIPRGVIILKERSEEILILRLIQILISGNSVIVIADKHSCNLTPYCDIFSTSKIPRGVINFLFNQNTKDLELSLCATDYVNYEKQLFTSNFEKMYINLTLSKQIILSLK